MPESDFDSGNKRIYSDILKVEFVYDIHAIQRALERDIAEEDMKNLINGRDTVCERQMNGRFRLSSGELTMIVGYENGLMRIITVFTK